MENCQFPQLFRIEFWAAKIKRFAHKLVWLITSLHIVTHVITQLSTDRQQSPYKCSHERGRPTSQERRTARCQTGRTLTAYWSTFTISFSLSLPSDNNNGINLHSPRTLVHLTGYRFNWKSYDYELWTLLFEKIK